MKTLLMTAVGSASALAMMQRYQATGWRVVACDIYPRSWNAAALQADEFFQALGVKDEAAYVAQRLDAVRRYDVQALIPLTDLEVDVLCSRKAEFLALGCVLCVPQEPVVRLCRDKLRMAQQLKAAGVCQTIPTWEAARVPKDAAFPLMLKPRSGRSSQGQAVVQTRQALDGLAKDGYIAQPFLEGNVFTVDVARDAQGQVQALARQELLRTGNGLGTTVQVYDTHPLEAVCAAIAREAGLVGVVNMEFIHHGEDYYFLEVNPRFSGGAGFSQLAGMDVAGLMLDCHLGRSIGQRSEVKAGVYTRRVEMVLGE